jgi:cytidylate kinase
MDIEYLDSGALYRAVTLLYIRTDASGKEFFQMLTPGRFDFRYENETFRTWLDDEEITAQLRSAEVSNTVSEVAAKPKVREFVNNLMRKAVQERTFIAEGRDLGTAVFPDADIKFFMTADVDTRAQRRYEEMKDKVKSVNFEQVRENIKSRDKKDAQREADPLKKAEEAIAIDTSEKSFEQQVEEFCSYISRQMK